LCQIFPKPLNRIPVAQDFKGDAVQPVVELSQVNVRQAASAPLQPAGYFICDGSLIVLPATMNAP
jgi:hypothetical protein